MTEYKRGVMLKCGCAAMAVDGDGKPACIIHNCNEPLEHQPDLTGRKARCSYYGKQTRRSECLYNGDVKEDGVWICRCERDSEPTLPFFKFKGEDSPSALYNCKICPYHWIAHQPLFEYTLEITRDWYKTKDTVSQKVRQKHWGGSKEQFMDWLEKDIARMIQNSKRPQFPGGDPSKVTIHKIEILSVIEEPSGRDHEFVPHGPYDYDEFYCGCHTWD